MKKFLLLFYFTLSSFSLLAQDNSDCFSCHEDKTLKGTRNGKTISVFVNEKKFAASVHGKNDCISCHTDLKDAELPHEETLKRATCTGCHEEANKMYNDGLHGKASQRKDPLAPKCQDCHGAHEITKVSDIRSVVFPSNIPYVCGKCHREGSPVQLQRNIPQDHILENYSESIHGEGLLKKGLAVSATCASCHGAHLVLPHTDARSSIARKNIATTCTKCHVAIEAVHRKIIKGELWEKEVHKLPACIDCHQPHKIRKVFYEQGMADEDCLRCHSNEGLKSARTGHSMFINTKQTSGSVHAKVACSQCHTGVNPSKVRPCENITSKVDCASCHAAVGDEYKMSTHGKLFARNDQNAPTCSECHGTHGILGKKNPASEIFPTNIPTLCAKCHREGETAAVRYQGTQHNIINNYSESIHGKGLLKSGLTVTATCTDCHSAHRELPHTDPNSTIHPSNISNTCGTCHTGIQEQFAQSIHSPDVTKTDKKLPVCNDCHSAHTIKRTDQDDFKFSVMNNCGKCHEYIASTYFDTYHGKVTQLGYAKTAKCFNCHGAHDIYPVTDARSHLNRINIVKTCQQCHPAANRQFAGYLSHATHHDPEKYPWLFWAFWGMTGLLLVTFVLAGTHTILWLPRSLQWRRELERMEREQEEAEKNVLETENKTEDGNINSNTASDDTNFRQTPDTSKEDNNGKV